MEAIKRIIMYFFIGVSAFGKEKVFFLSDNFLEKFPSLHGNLGFKTGSMAVESTQNFNK